MPRQALPVGRDRGAAVQVDDRNTAHDSRILRPNQPDQDWAKPKQLQEASYWACEARRLAYDLEPLRAEDVADIAREVDELATSVHMLAQAVRLLCDLLEPGPRP